MKDLFEMLVIPWKKISGLFIFAVIAMACSNNDEPSCYAGEHRSCACEGARTGFAACLTDQSGYGTCDCSGAVPGLEGGVLDAGTGSDGGSSGKIPYMQSCESHEQCETGLCHPFNAKGPHCTKRCSGDGECPAPSPGCNNQGVCKVP